MWTAARLFASRAVWSVTGKTTVGRFLVDSLESEDEDVRMIAGMLLTNAGRRAEPLLEEALKDGRSLPMVIGVLGSIGDADSVQELRPLLDSKDPEVANAAREAIRVIGATPP